MAWVNDLVWLGHQRSKPGSSQLRNYNMSAYRFTRGPLQHWLHSNVISSNQHAKRVVHSSMRSRFRHHHRCYRGEWGCSAFYSRHTTRLLRLSNYPPRFHRRSSRTHRTSPTNAQRKTPCRSIERQVTDRSVISEESTALVFCHFGASVLQCGNQLGRISN